MKPVKNIALILTCVLMLVTVGIPSVRLLSLGAPTKSYPLTDPRLFTAIRNGDCHPELIVDYISVLPANGTIVKIAQQTPNLTVAEILKSRPDANFVVEQHVILNGDSHIEAHRGSPTTQYYLGIFNTSQNFEFNLDLIKDPTYLPANLSSAIFTGNLQMTFDAASDGQYVSGLFANVTVNGKTFEYVPLDPKKIGVICR